MSNKLWTIKAILKGFYLASSLGVNFHKSILIGINVGSSYLELDEDFLHCRIEYYPLRYHGLHFVENPQWKSTWDPLVNLMQNKFNSLNHRYISLGGRMILLNFVLNAIFVFFISFIKMPIKVWKTLVGIKRRFL